MSKRGEPNGYKVNTKQVNMEWRK